MKDGGSEGEVVVSQLKPVDVGMDADELPITSCVVVPTEAIAEVRKGRSLPKNQQTMLTLLEVAGKEGLLLSEWNERAKAQGIGVKRHASLYDAQQALKQAKLVHAMQSVGTPIASPNRGSAVCTYVRVLKNPVPYRTSVHALYTVRRPYMYRTHRTSS